MNTETSDDERPEPLRVAFCYTIEGHRTKMGIEFNRPPTEVEQRAFREYVRKFKGLVQ